MGINYFYNLKPELHDGLVNKSTLHSLFNIFHDYGWTIEKFHKAFIISAVFTVVFFVLLIIAVLMQIKGRKTTF